MIAVVTGKNSSRSFGLSYNLTPIGTKSSPSNDYNFREDRARETLRRNSTFYEAFYFINLVNGGPSIIIRKCQTDLERVWPTPRSTKFWVSLAYINMPAYIYIYMCVVSLQRLYYFKTILFSVPPFRRAVNGVIFIDRIDIITQRVECGLQLISS